MQLGASSPCRLAAETVEGGKVTWGVKVAGEGGLSLVATAFLPLVELLGSGRGLVRGVLICSTSRLAIASGCTVGCADTTCRPW